MFQHSLFADDYDMDQINSEIRYLSDLKDICHASSQGLVTIASALVSLDNPNADIDEILGVVKTLNDVLVSVTSLQEKLIVKGSYRGEK